MKGTRQSRQSDRTFRMTFVACHRWLSIATERDSHARYGHFALEKGVNCTDGGERSVTPGAATSTRQPQKGRRNVARQVGTPHGLLSPFQGLVGRGNCKTSVATSATLP